ncbi:hypothetical protein HHK36_001060 [Tetracentron sinense]|uniref:CDC20/Fizzy WD40 domain-containing protein n=1 Tax=Tetracentron sinense TaxID=13715 RepID=A0A834ZS62_TETSI|nr:hypothetical protein HHK36_001060 [Tetracentron sinense]
MDDSATPSMVNQSGIRKLSSSSLNLPPHISANALSVETCSSSSSSSSHVDRLVGVGYHPSPSRTIYSDRFIPSRSGSNFALFDISPSSNSSADGREDGSGAYATLIRTALFGPDYGVVSPVNPEKQWGSNGRNSLLSPPSRNIFRYKTETKRSLYSLSPIGFDDELPGVIPSPAKAPRKVPRSPYKVLDAPALQDDFYLNLVDWSSHNVLAVGLGNCVYLWNACSSKARFDFYFNSLSKAIMNLFLGGLLLVKEVEHLKAWNYMKEIWDSSRCKRVRTMESHRLRVGALAWSSSLLSSGSRDKTILQRDIRSPEDIVSKLTGHKSEVCGLKWSYDNRELASGGNDNRLFVWNQHSTQPVLKYCEHTAAVKAIAWSPHLHGLLASGGGTADRCIRFWNTTTNSHLSCMDTGSQVIFMSFMI